MDRGTLYPELVPIAIVSALIPLLCLPWQWQAKNVATLSIIVWFIITNLIYAVDAILWRDNLEIKAEVWCDISTKLIIGANFAIPSASFCAAVHIEHITAIRTYQFIIANKRHRDIFELVMSFGLPVIIMGMHFVVQGHRFDIIKGYGCRPAIYYSIPALIIVWIPPLLMGLGSVIFAISSIRHIIVRLCRHTLPLNWSNAYTIRFTFMVVVQLIWITTFTACVLGFNIKLNGDLQPWVNWNHGHINFSRVDTYDVGFMNKVTQTVYYLHWWIIPASTWAFTIFFGSGDNALAGYERCFVWIRNRFSS